MSENRLPSIDRRQLLVIAVAFMCLTALPGSAAAASSSEELVVGSQHDSQAEFSNAQTLTNLMTTSSGDGAVELATGTTVFSDGFEDEAADSGLPTAWEFGPADSGGSNAVSVSTTSVYAGSQAMRLQPGASETSDVRPSEQTYATAKTNPVSFAIRVGTNGPDAGDDSTLRLYEGGSQLLIVGMYEGDLQYYDGSWNVISTAPDIGDWVHITVKNIDPSTDTYAVEWSVKGGTSGSTSGLAMSSAASNGYDSSRMVVQDADVFVDDFRGGESSVESARYVSPLHAVSNAEQAAINITQASNVSVNATVRTDGGTVLNQTDLTSTGNHTLVLADTSSDKLEVVLDVNVTGDNPAFELGDESILFTNHAPSASNSTATPTATSTNNENVQLSIDVSDQEFTTVQSDNVTVTAFVDGSAIGSKTISSNQTVTFTATGLSDGSHSWHVELKDEYGLTSKSDTFSFTVNHYAPALDNSNASPQGNSKQTTRDITLSIPLKDIDFAESSGDEVAVEFFVDGSSVGTVNVTANGTVEKTVTVSSGGDHTWHVEATDEYGQTTTSNTFKFKVPATITFRNEKNTSEILTNVQVNVTAYYGNETVRRNVTNGKLNLTGFPVDQPIIIRAAGENYTTRTAVIESVYKQSNVFLLKKDVPTYEIRFDLSDATGEYPRDNTVLFVERDLKINGSVEWRVISGDNFGVQGVPVTLEQDERYRLRVRNLETGATATIGAFTPIQSETVVISPGSAKINVVDSKKEYGWSVTENESGQYILFEYLDTTNNTESLKLTVHERFNKSNVLVDNETFTNANDLVYQIPMTANQTNTTWTAQIYIERNGNTTRFSQPITGATTDLLPGSLDQAWRTGIGVFVLLITGMAFSELNRTGGAVATSLVGGMLWQIGFLSTVSTGPAVVLAIGISVLYHYRSGGGA